MILFFFPLCSVIFLICRCVTFRVVPSLISLKHEAHQAFLVSCLTVKKKKIIDQLDCKLFESETM